MATATQKGVPYTLLAATTTGTGTAVAIPITSDHQRISIITADTTSGGTLLLEEAHTVDYSGTWSVLATITASALTGGDVQVYHIFGTLGFVRARVSSDITGGGTIAAEIVTN